MYNSYNGYKINWLGLNDSYGNALIFELGYSKDKLAEEIQTEHVNPLIKILQSDPVTFIQACERAGNGTTNMDGVARTVVLAQMVLYDTIHGPEQDGKQKALRRHWYAYFKQFSQMFAFAMGKVRKNEQGLDEMVDVQWSGRLSKVYGGFVDGGVVTYKDLWIEDASRMINVFGTFDELYPGFQLIIAVEKDSLFSDFVNAAKAMGAVAIISGKGKNSKAAAELMVRKLGWKNPQENTLDRYETMVIHLSDHDFDGEGVIGPTFGEQLRRYLGNVIEARIGVKPTQVQEIVDNAWDASYQVKVSNKGYRDWANEKALFWATCAQCGHEQFVIGCDENGASQEECSNCGSFELNVLDESYDEPHGFEVESLRSADYYRAMVDAVVELVDWESIVSEMRRSAKPVSWDIISTIKTEKLDSIPQYHKIQEAISILQNAQSQLETEVDNVLSGVVEDTIHDMEWEWRDMGEDPTIDEFKDYVVQQARSGYGSVWRPFNLSERNQLIVDAIKDNSDVSEKLDVLDIENFDDVVTDVNDVLEG
jgi:hypothetical protein